MTPDAFFEKFDLFADAPDAVVKMRELILQLAMRGRLVSQDPRDGTARELLDQIIHNGTKAHDRRNRIVRADRENSVTAPYSLPSSWTWTTLGSVASWGSGSTPARGNPDLFGGVHTWLKSGELNDDRMLKGSSEQITDIALAKGSFRRNQPGDILFAMYGATVGKAAILAESAVTNQAVCGATVCEGIQNHFMFHYLVAERENFRNASEGGAQPNFSKDKILIYPFPLPPLAEQKRIVAKVDELMALCDRLEEQQQERETRHAALARASLARFAEAPTPANLEFLFHNSYAISPADLRKSILTLAVQGKLVPQDPSDEPAEKTLSRLGLASTFTPPNGVDGDDESLPLAWTRIRFEDVALVAGGVTLGRKLGERKTVALPYLRVANVKRGEIDLSVIKEVSIGEDEVARYSLQENDLLMTEGGDWDKVGRAAIWRAQIPVCLHQNHVFRARSRSTEIAPFWFELYFNSPIGRAYFESASKQTTNLASINMRQVRGCPIPLPPLAEQRRIVAKVDELMALVDTLEAQLATVRTTAAVLLQAVVHDLLTGPQPQISPAEPAVAHDAKSKRPNRHFARALLSAEIVHQLHAEPTFGRIKHQKVFHLCESLARIPEVDGQYSRKAAGPFDNKLVYANESELKKQKWYDTVDREKAGHRYVPLEKAGAHARYVEQYWPDKLETIRNLITLMRTWDTDRCEIFSTTCAAWNDLLIWGRDPTDEAILHEILNRWAPEKRRIPREKWIAAIRWMKEKGYVPTGFGRATAEPE